MYVDFIRYRLIYRSSKGVALAVDNDLNLVGSVLRKLKCAIVQTSLNAVDKNLFEACSFIEAVAESGGNGSYDNEGSLGYVIQSIGHLNGVLTGLGDLGSFLVFDHVAILGYDNLCALVCHDGYRVGKTAIVHVDSKVNRLVDFKGDLGHVLRLIGNANYVFTLVADGSTRNVLANLFSVLDKNSGCFLVKNINGYGSVYGKVCLVPLGSYLGSLGVDNKLICVLCTVEVFKHDDVRAVLGELVAGLIFDCLAVLRYADLRFIVPSKGYFLIGMTAVFNACKVARRCGLNVGDLTCNGIHAGTEFIGNDDLIHTAGSKLINKIVEIYRSAVIVSAKGYPSGAAIGRLVKLKSLEVGFLILALGHSDHELLLCFVCLEAYGGSISGDHNAERLGLTNVVYCYRRVRAAFTELADLAKAEAADKLAVLVIDVEHCHLIKRIGNGNIDFVLEVVGSLKVDLHCTALANRIVEIGECANHGKVILAGVAVGIGNNHYVLALGVVNAANEGLTVNRDADILTDHHLVCEDVAVCRVAVKVLVRTCGCGLLFPIVVVDDTVLCVLSDYLVQALNGEICYKLIGIARLEVNEVGSVLCVRRVNGIHRNARIPSGVIPLCGLYLGVFTYGRKFKSLFIGGKCEGIAINVRRLKVFLHERICENILLGGYELGLPLIACHIHNLNDILSGIDGVNGRTVGYCLSVNGYGLNGGVGVRVSVRPRDHNVTVGLAARNVRGRYLLAGTVDDNSVLTRGVPCGILTVEYVLTNLVKLGSRYVVNERGGTRHLYVAGFITLEGDVICIGVRAAADALIVCPKLSVGNLTVDGDCIGRGLIACQVHGVEGISSLCGKSGSRGISRIARSSGLLYVGRSKTDVIGRNKLDRACIGVAARGSRRRTCVQNTRGFGIVQRDRNGRGLITRLIYTVEVVGSLGCELSSAGVRGVVARSRHFNVDSVNTRDRIGCGVFHVRGIGIRAAALSACTAVKCSRRNSFVKCDVDGGAGIARLIGAIEVVGSLCGELSSARICNVRGASGLLYVDTRNTAVGVRRNVFDIVRVGIAARALGGRAAIESSRRCGSIVINA